MFFEVYVAYVREQRMREAAHADIVREALRAHPPLRAHLAAVLRVLASYVDGRHAVPRRMSSAGTSSASALPD